LGFGGAALGGLLFKDQLFGADAQSSMQLGVAQFAPKAKRIIYLFQNGAPSQLETFDYKPLLNKMHGEDLPASIRMVATFNRHDCLSGKISFGRFHI